MTLIEAMKTNKYFKRPHWTDSICYFEPKTGPQKNLVDCDYFIVKEDSVEEFSTSLDLYPEDISASDYELVEEL